MLFTARGPWLHVSLFAISLTRGASAAGPPAPSSPPPSPSPGPAAPIEGEANPSEPIIDPQARVGELINEGQALFDTADYVGAIDRWTGAYAQLPDDPHLAAARNLLSYQIAQAHIEAFAMDPQLSHLRKAERLLRQYIADLDPSETESFLDAGQRLAAVEAQIQAATPPPAINPVLPNPLPVQDLGAATRKRDPLTLVGGISLGLGGALLIGTAVSAGAELRLHAEHTRALQNDASQAELDRLQMRDLRAHRATIATAVAGGVLVATGVALVITGRVHRRALTAQPTVTPGFIGARLSLRF